MFRKKIVTMMLLTLCFLMVGSVSALATGYYSFHFIPPAAGCACSTNAIETDGTFTPYVDPAGVTAETTYYLARPGSSLLFATNIVENVTSAKTYFTYDVGYGGVGTSYKLWGYPSNTFFQEYYAAGEWKP